VQRRLTIAIIATALTTAMAGCQSFPVSLDDKKVFKAPSYYGKEIRSDFFRNHHRVEESGGHDLRGYQFGPRHWFI